MTLPTAGTSLHRYSAAPPSWSRWDRGLTGDVVDVLKYARVERERRYLVGSIPDGVVRVDDISDAYVEGTRLRLREVLSSDAAVRKLGHKIRLGSGPREIACTSLYLDDAEWSVLSALPACHLHKRRHHIDRDGYSFCIDEYDDGALVAEFDDGDAAPAPLPAWLDVLADVTDDESWTGGQLAAKHDLMPSSLMPSPDGN